jgi:hypothetical protein
MFVATGSGPESREGSRLFEFDLELETRVGGARKENVSFIFSPLPFALTQQEGTVKASNLTLCDAIIITGDSQQLTLETSNSKFKCILVREPGL